MSRLDRHPNRRGPLRGRGGRRQENVQPGNEQNLLPPRRVKHPSNKQQMTSWFYNSLIVLFIALVCGLFYVGMQLDGK